MFRDKDEKWRTKVMMQWAKVKRFSPVGNTFLLLLANSLLIYGLIEWRMHPYIGIPIIAFLVLTGYFTLADIWVRRLEMYRTESRADMIFIPYSVYALSPIVEMHFRNIYIPIMEMQRNIISHLHLDSSMNKEIEENIKRVRNWVDIGYIPKADFPEHLKKYYITTKERRL